MALNLAPHVPRMAPDDGVVDAARKALGKLLIEAHERVGEVTLVVDREAIVEVCRALRDTPGLEYQQLMDIAGVDYPQREERFEVVYHLLSLTKNRRVRVKVSTNEEMPVPSVTGLWPVAGWLEREVFDMYGVPFSGNADLRRILTDYGFEGYPQRKDFPLTGHVELRYSEVEKRVVYEPVSLPQDFRTFDFLMPWEGPEYRLPGDEKASGEAPPAPSLTAASGGAPAPSAKTSVKKTTDSPADTGGGAPADKAATKKAREPRSKKAKNEVSKQGNAPEPKLGRSARRRPKGGAQ